MAIVNQYGTINSPTPGKAVIDYIESALALHSNWEFVEEYTHATVYKWRVWRCKGVGNAFGSDWYLLLHWRTDAASVIAAMPCESYNTTTHAATNIVGPGAGGTTTPGANGEFTGSGGSTPMVLTTTPSNYPWNLSAPVSTAFTQFVNVSNDRLCVASSLATSGGYFGLFDSLAAADPFPLCMAGESCYMGGASYEAGWSRHPMADSADYVSQSLWFRGDPSRVGLENSGYNSPDKIGGKVFFPRIALQTPNESLVGKYRGLLLDALGSPNGSTASAVGDTITIDGVDWMYFGSSLAQGFPWWVRTA